MHAAFAAVVATALSLAPAQVKTGKDWPQWRGPNRDAISTETGLLSEWPKGGPKLLWTAKDVNGATNVGVGLSGIAIANGKIYTLGDRDGACNFVCLDAATGKVLWTTPFSPTWGNPRGADPGPRCTPTVAGDRVYGLTAHGHLACVDAAEGSLIWKKDFKKDLGGRMMSGWSYSESPLVDGNKLIVTPGGKSAFMVALNKETGDVLWKCQPPSDCGAGYASPVIAEMGGRRQYVTIAGPPLGAVGVDAQTGKFLWSYGKIANSTANIPTPLVKGNQVFVSTGYGTGAALLQLTPDGKGGVQAKEIYFLKGKTLQNHHGGMVLLGDHVFGGHNHNDGQPFCLNLKSGQFAWGPERNHPGSGSAAVVYADGHLYFRFDDNTMVLVEATPKAFNIKGEFQLPMGTSRPGWQHPVIHEGRLLVRAHDQLYCYDIKQK